MLTSTAMIAFKNFFLGQIAFASYKVNGTYYETPIEPRIFADGRVAFSFTIGDTPPGDITVTEVRLHDHNGVVFAAKTENIIRQGSIAGINYQFLFSLSET